MAPDERAAMLLAAAIDAFAGVKYDDVSIEALAAEQGVSPALVHRYFGSKRGLFLSVVEHQIGLFTAVIDTESAGATPRERLAAVMAVYLDFVAARPQGYAYLLGVRGGRDLEVERRVLVARRHVHERLLVLLGIKRPTATQRLQMSGWIGFVESCVVEWLHQPTISRRKLVVLLLDAADSLVLEPPTAQ
jgi:AcrR family transcriptional regulator